MSSSYPLPFLSIPPSCPCHFLGMSASFSMYAPCFHCQSFSPTSPFVLWFPCPLLPFHSQSLPLFSVLSPSCPFQFPFVSLSFPLHTPCFQFFPFMSLSVPLRFPFISPCFPVMSTSCPLHVLAFPCISSPHFPARPCISPSLPGIFVSKKMYFFLEKERDVSHVFAKGCQKHSSSRFQQKEPENPNRQRAGRGIRAWDPCFAPAPRRHFLVEHHQVAARYVGTPPPRALDAWRSVGG